MASATTSSSSLASGLGGFLSNLGRSISSALSKAETFGEKLLENLEGDELAIAQDTVTVVNQIEGGITILQNIAAVVPGASTTVTPLLNLATDALNDAKALAIAVETGAAQQPGGETNV